MFVAISAGVAKEESTLRLSSPKDPAAIILFRRQKKKNPESGLWAVGGRCASAIENCNTARMDKYDLARSRDGRRSLS